VTRVLLADDEPHLRRRFAERLRALWPSTVGALLELCPPASDGEEALARIRSHAPDVAFLDIRMPGLSGIEVARRILEETSAGGAPPIVVFVTAFDDHAVDAFETAAMDYLLKPVDPERLRRCLERLAPRLSPMGGGPASEDAPAADGLRSLLERLDERAAAPAPLRWLRAGHGEDTELVAIDEVVYFRAGDKYVTAYTAHREHVLRLSLKQLVDQLDGDAFWQIHRALIVNVGQVLRARRDLRGRYVITLRDRSEKLRTSLSYAHRFRAM